MGKVKPKNKFRNIIRQIHLYLGLITGLVVFIVSITGCLWAFQEEINNLISDVPEIAASNAPQLDPLEVKEIAQEAFPEKHIHGTLYEGGTSPIEVIFYQAEPQEFYTSVFIHPQTGEILHTENHLSGFFHFLMEGHMHLWLPEEIGSQIVAWSTVIFFLMLISGVILWWPKNKSAKKQRVWFRWKPTTKWKRKNYDLHQIVGFYASFIAVFFILTGLIMTFDAFREFFYKSIGGEKQVAFAIPENTSGTFTNNDGKEPIRSLLPLLEQEYPNAESYEIHYPYNEQSSIYVEVGNSKGLYYNSDYVFYDQNTLTQIPSETVYGLYEEAGISDKILRMNYDIHVGAIGGIPGKILAFLISFLCASLPVTGFLLWYGRKFKTKKKPKLQTQREVQFAE